MKTPIGNELIKKMDFKNVTTEHLQDRINELILKAIHIVLMNTVDFNIVSLEYFNLVINDLSFCHA